LKDGKTGVAGTDYDRIVLSGGNLGLGAQATLDLRFIGSATAPAAAAKTAAPVAASPTAVPAAAPVAAGAAAAGTGATAVAAAAAPGAAPATAAKSSTSAKGAEDNFGMYAAEHPAPPPSAKSLTAKVTSVSGAVVQLEGGQTWRIDDSDPLLKAGDVVTISRASLGSFILVTPSKRSHRAKRLQ